MFQMMMVTMGPHLDLNRTTSFHRSASEWHGQDTNETTVNLLIAVWGVKWVGLDKRGARGLPKSVGYRNRFRSHGATTGAVVLFLVTASVINFGHRQEAWMGDMSDIGIIVRIGRSVSQTHVGGHLCDYDTDRTGADMLSC
jgi:hypothetical protein